MGYGRRREGPELRDLIAVCGPCQEERRPKNRPKRSLQGGSIAGDAAELHLQQMQQRALTSTAHQRAVAANRASGSSFRPGGFLAVQVRRLQVIAVLPFQYYTGLPSFPSNITRDDS